MKKIKFISTIITILLLTFGCGFKVVKQNEYMNFKIVDIETSGEKRINYKVKNKLLLLTKRDNENNIDVILNTTKKRSVKEKNIKNEITKYLITIKMDVKFKQINNEKLYNFSVISSKDYDVSSKYSATLRTEKKILDILSDEMVDKIINKISVKLNAI